MSVAVNSRTHDFLLHKMRFLWQGLAFSVAVRDVVTFQ